MKALEQTTAFFLKPVDYSIKVVQNKNATYGESFLARMCFIAQIISSIVALPFILIVGLATAFINLCRGDEVSPAFSDMGMSFKQLELFTLPLSLVGIFAPLSTTNSLGDSLATCLY